MRMESEPPDYPQELPDLRRRIIIIDYDFGEVVHVIEMHRTNRIDQYRVVADGKEWKQRAGWSKVLEELFEGTGERDAMLIGVFYGKR